MKTYPVNLVLEDRLVILLGGEGEISEKIPGLLEVGAQVRVIAPTVNQAVRDYAVQEKIEWLARDYQAGDLARAFLVFVARENETVHEIVWQERATKGQLVNVMDVLPKCNFHAAALVRRGQLTISIGTGGAAPALAVTLRKRFEKMFGPEYAEFLTYAQQLRSTLSERIPLFKDRAAFWYALVEGDALALLRSGERTLFEAEVQALISRYE